MRKQSERLLSLALLPIFIVGALPMLMFVLMGIDGLGILGILMICAGLADGLNANSDFSEQVIVRGYARRSERAIHKSNLQSAVRFATFMIVAGAGLIIASVCGVFYFS
jgi:hypothetical protein